MRIDPVVMLAEELRSTEWAIKVAREKNDNDLICRLLAKASILNAELYRTVPTSALGAAELLNFAASALPFSAARYALHLRTTADRLASGERTFSDLVWLRSMREALAGGLCGEAGTIAADLLGLAIAGAARPVLVFRAVTPPRGETRVQA